MTLIHNDANDGRCRWPALRKTLYVVILAHLLLWLVLVSVIEEYIKLPEVRTQLLETRHTKSSIASLIDLPIIQRNELNSSGTGKMDLNDTFHSIMWYKKPTWVSLHDAAASLGTCAYNNCRMTDDAADVYNHSAIIFTLTEGLDKSPPMRPEARPADQVWVLFYLESPVNVRDYTDGITDDWRYTINWTMTYRLDSDVLRPYGALQRQVVPCTRDHGQIYDRKSRFAAWIVSDCGAKSGRDEYVYELRKHGVPVDVYGKCGNTGYHERKKMTDLLNNDYYFYFAFENSLCPDYMTEKLFWNYNFDIVIVVRGGANYKQLLPRNVVIDTSNFNSSKALADYLMHVHSSRHLYTEYLKRKDEYVSFDHDDVTDYSYCKLCEMLNNKQENINVYDNMVDYIHRSDYSCVAPTDVLYVHRKTFVLIAIIFATCLVYSCCMAMVIIAIKR